MIRGRHFFLLCALAGGSLFPFSGNAQTLASSPATGCPHTVDPDALRTLAHNCAKDLSRDANCRVYAKDVTQEYAVVKDCSLGKPAAYLIIPIEKVTGIEDGATLSPSLSGLWQDAWLWARKYPGAPEPQTALAINSQNARSQNQLHIHISCVLPDVKAALESRNIPFYPAKAVSIELGPRHNLYQAVKVRALSGDTNPFQTIQAIAGVTGHMKDQSIAVVGSPKANEYYVLNTTAAGANRGHAEELLEQTCSSAHSGN